jgi:hypothetical protein
MIPIGVGIVFLSYTTGLWGYCLIRGYNVKFTQLFASTWPGANTSGPTSATGAHPLPTPTGQPSQAQQLTQGP